MNEAMAAEFDTVAEWTAEVALDLDPDHHLPAGCRGSGRPGSLRWFLDRLEVSTEHRMLDCGGGVGGPAAFARAEVGVQPVLTDPAAGACRAARRLFGLTVVQAASSLPFRTHAFDVAWSLGVVCTVPDQPLLLRELRRVLTPQGRLGLLVFVANGLAPSRRPEGNDFPTAERLGQLLDDAGLVTENSATAAEYEQTPTLWQERAETVEAELERRHRDDPAWVTAERQSRLIGDLLADGQVTPTMIVARVR